MFDTEGKTGPMSERDEEIVQQFANLLQGIVNMIQKVKSYEDFNAIGPHLDTLFSNFEEKYPETVGSI